MGRRLQLAGALLVAGYAWSAQAATEIQWWHALSGANQERLNGMADSFNASQPDYKVVPVFKGTYVEALNAGIAAFRAGRPPHILQVFEVGTATMMGARGAIKPVHQLMADAGEPFDPAAYLPAVTAYFSTSDDRMISFPFNSSSPVLYLNRDAFARAGLNPDQSVRTWPEVFAAARAMRAAGWPCGLTTTWPSWVQLENFSAWHDVPYATKANGMAGLDAQLAFNSPLHVRHIESLVELQKTRTFDYGGRGADAKAKFISGECAMLTESSAGYGDISRVAFPFSVSALPYYPDVAGAPRNTIIGGASLWVLSGHSADEDRGVARLFAFLSQPEIQATWHQASGYLPITRAAYALTKAQGYYDRHPGTETALLQMTAREPTDNSRGLRLGNLPQIRAAAEEELEAALAGKQTAQQALDKAVERGNALLRQFERNHRP
jgi:sn-glycerol 3-phosphate transport system substrate-binding protein